MTVKIIHENCDPVLAKNRDLPRNSYLVTYIAEGELQYDIVQAGSRVNIFDKYYDKYKEVRGIRWTEGTVNPKLWNYQAQDSNKKKKR